MHMPLLVDEPRPVLEQSGEAKRAGELAQLERVIVEVKVNAETQRSSRRPLGAV